MSSSEHENDAAMTDVGGVDDACKDAAMMDASGVHDTSKDQGSLGWGFCVRLPQFMFCYPLAF